MGGEAASKECCPVDGQRLAYWQRGQGEVVLLVHGITTYAFLWEPVARQLAERYRVIAVDLLGCGDSDMPLDVSYGLSAHADRLRTFCRQLELPRLHFVGHDLGAGIGQIFATRYPDQLLDLTLINPVAYDYWPVQPITTLRAPILGQLLAASLDLGMLHLLVRRGFLHKELVDATLVETYRRPFSTPLGRKALMHFARALDARDLLQIVDRLQRLELPVQILWGKADAYLSADIPAQLAADIPNCRRVDLDAGHYSPLDAPDEIAGALLAFFASSTPS